MVESGRLSPNAVAEKQETLDALVSVLLDRSGSMEHLRQATIEGFNGFVSEQRKNILRGADARLSVTQFDDMYEPNFMGEPLENVPVLSEDSYAPRGMTALLDSLVHAIRDTEEWVKRETWTGRVLFLIVTDGYENSSKTETRESVANLIRAKEADGWSFAFQGANIDSFAEAGKLGIHTNASMDFAATPAGTRAAWSANSTATSDYVASGASGSMASSNFYRKEGDQTAKVETAPVKAPKGKLEPKKDSTSG